LRLQTDFPVRFGANKKMNKKNITKILIVIILALFLGVRLAQAQDAKTENVPDQEKKAVLEKDPKEIIDYVNLNQAKIESQSGNKITVSFSLENREQYQPQIYYGVTLLKDTPASQTTYGRKIYEEEISLAPGEKAERKIEYSAPSVLRGKYKVYLWAKNRDGADLGIGYAGEADLAGSGNLLEIDKNDCFFKSDKDGIKSNFWKGMLLDSDQEIEAVCKVKNTLDQKTSFFPEINVFNKSFFGKTLKKEKQAEVFLNPGEAKEISFSLENMAGKQLLAVNLVFLDKNSMPISNEVDSFLGYSGETAEILNVRLDNNYFKTNDLAEAWISWKNSGENYGGKKMEVQMTGENGENCIGKPFEQELSREKELSFKASLLVIKNCKDPKISLAIKNSRNEILDQSIYQFKTKSEEAVVQKKNPSPYDFKKMLGIIIIIILAAVLVHHIIKKIRLSRYKFPMIILLAFLAVMLLPKECSALDLAAPITDETTYQYPSDATWTITALVGRNAMWPDGLATPFNIDVEICNPDDCMVNPPHETCVKVADDFPINGFGTWQWSHTFNLPLVKNSGWQNFAHVKLYVNNSFNQEKYGTVQMGENGVCGSKTSYVNENLWSGCTSTEVEQCQASCDQTCASGTLYTGTVMPNVVGNMSGNFHYTCNKINFANNSPQCNVSVKLDGKCGGLNNQPVCGDLATVATDMETYKSPYCDNLAWIVDPITNVSGWGSVPGNMSNRSGTGPWSWTCKGVGGGSDVNCQTSSSTFMATCGPSAVPILTPIQPNSGLCSSGSTASVYYQENNTEYPYEPRPSYKWICDVLDSDGNSLGCGTPCEALIIPKCVSATPNIRYYKQSEITTGFSDANFCTYGAVVDQNLDGIRNALDIIDNSGNLTWKCQNGTNPTIANCDGKKISASISISPTPINVGDKPNISWSSINTNNAPGCRGSSATGTAAVSSWVNAAFTRGVNGTDSSIVHNTAGTAKYSVICRSRGEGPLFSSQYFSSDPATSNILQVNAPVVSCGSASINNQDYCLAPVTGLCSSGATPSAINDSDLSKFSWTCTNGITVPCWVNRGCSTDSVWKEVENK
jgi:hypothetical protein